MARKFCLTMTFVSALLVFAVAAQAQTTVNIRPAPDANNGWIVPWDGTAWAPGPSSRVQSLYLVGQIGVAGTLTEIWWFPNGADNDGAAPLSSATTLAAVYTNVVVRVGHSNLAQLGVGFDANFNVGGPTTVANIANYNVPAGVPVGTPVQIPINPVFVYDGVNNLIVEVSATSALTPPTNIWELSDVGGTYINRTVAHATDAAAANGTQNNFLSSIRLVILAAGGGGGAGGGEVTGGGSGGGGCIVNGASGIDLHRLPCTLSIGGLLVIALAFWWRRSARHQE